MKKEEPKPMTRLEVFAAHALAGALARYGTATATFDDIANDAYECALALEAKFQQEEERVARIKLGIPK